MEFKKFMEALKGNQHKLDKNKNGKLDAHDFKLLRKEEEECEYEDEDEKEMDESVERVARADYKQSPSGRKTHREITFKDGSPQEDESKKVSEEVDLEESVKIVDRDSDLDQEHFKIHVNGKTEHFVHHNYENSHATDSKEEIHYQVKRQLKHLSPARQKAVTNAVHASYRMKEEVDLKEGITKVYHKFMAKRAGKKADHAYDMGDEKEFQKQVDNTEYHRVKAGGRPTRINTDPDAKMLTTRAPRKEEVELEERTMTDAEMKKREDIVKGMKKNVAGFKSKYGDRAKEVMYATATKMAMKEESEIDESFINGREYASQGVMHPDHAKLHKVGDTRDFYAHGTGDKISGKVTKNDGKSVHIQADKSSGGKLHKFSVTPHLPKPVNEAKKEDLPFDPPYKKVPAGNVTDKSGAIHTPMSQARHLARQAMKKQMKEAFDIDISDEQADSLVEAANLEQLDEAVESGNKGYGYHGQHESDVADKKYSAMHAKVKKVAGEAGHLRDAKKPNVMVKHYLDSRHGRHLAGNEHDHEYIKKDFGKFKKAYKESDFAKESVGFDEEGNLMAEKLSFSDFLNRINEQLLEYETKNGVYRHKGSYGSSYQGDDDEDDDKPKKPAEPAVKRGRGRPAGSKSGANQKVGSGKSYGGIAHHTLNLPTSK